MVDAGLVGGDARITIRRESPEDVGFREIFVSMDGEQIAILKPYETFTYAAANQRSPFVAGMPASATATTGVRPDQNRPREFLEQFSLDTLKMVGTLRLAGRTYGLVQTRDGLVHRVLPGNHLGQADGRITGIEEGRIALIEIVPDGMGGFIERPAALALSE